MPLSWNEIKIRARAFSKEGGHESSEDAEAKSFWDAFFEVNAHEAVDIAADAAYAGRARALAEGSP